MQLTGKEILLLEDNVFERKALKSFLEKRGAEVYEAGSLKEAVAIIETVNLDCAVMDIHLPDGHSLTLLTDGKVSENVLTIVMTADETLKNAIDAMKAGAADFLVKPFNYEELPLLLTRANTVRNTTRIQGFEKTKARALSGDFYMGESLKSINEQLEKVLRMEARLKASLPPILITGETGTGKTRLARWIHENGSRREGPFVDLNCSNISEHLAESELFGHEKGAFTDAREARIGLFEACDGGTLFLDEITSLSLPVQAKVLKAIEERQIRRVGGRKMIAVDFRLIAASLEDLAKLSTEGRFREDLFHRLNLIHLGLPALRERRSDLPALTKHLLDRIAHRYQMKGLKISALGMEQLQCYRWPGNVRELEHELERAIIYSDRGEIEFPSLPVPNSSKPMDIHDTTWFNSEWELPPEGFSLESVQSHFIQLALQKSGGKLSGAARLLGLPRHVLRYMIEGR
jgi:DNA-binding NtrC family response regulator